MSKLDPTTLKRQLCEEHLWICGNTANLKILIMNLAVRFWRLPEQITKENPHLQRVSSQCVFCFLQVSQTLAWWYETMSSHPCLLVLLTALNYHLHLRRPSRKEPLVWQILKYKHLEMPSMVDSAKHCSWVHVFSFLFLSPFDFFKLPFGCVVPGFFF
jgi:hypothetical protein